MSAVPFVNVTRADDVARLIGVYQSLGLAHRVPLLRAAMHGRIAFVAVERGGEPPLRHLKKLRSPAVVLIGDDDYLSTGPDGWPGAVKLRRWARGAMVHGAGGKTEHYALAVGMALERERLLFIETSSVHARGWGEFLLAGSPPVPFVGMLPHDGAHPVMPAREAMQ